MFSTPKKRLFELKKELKVCKKFLDKANGNKCFGEFSYSNIGGFTFILNTGELYFISHDTINFPNIDFKKIVYISKTFDRVTYEKNGKIYKTNNNYSNYDSNIGLYNISDDYGYFQSICNRFNVTKFMDE